MATMFPLQPLQADPEIVDFSFVLPSYLNGGYEPQIIQAIFATTPQSTSNHH